MSSLVQTVILGLLVGALYALMASGLTLIFGVMRVINLAHGAFAILAAFLTYTLWQHLGLDPLLSIPIVMVVMFGLGWLVYVTVIRHVRGAHVSMTVLATFGIALLLEGVMGFIWGNTSTAVRVSYTEASIQLGPFYVPLAMLIAALIAVVVIGGLYLILNRTWAGRAIRAASANENGALLVGVNVATVAALTFAIGVATLGAGGAMLSTIYPFLPGTHYQWIARLLAIVVLGGLGSLPGAILGALVIGVGEMAATTYLGAAWPVAVPFLVIIVVLITRPQGILGTRLREDAVRMSTPTETPSTNKSPLARLLDPRLEKLATRVVVGIAAIVIVLFPLSPSISAQNTVILALVLAIGASGLNVITGFTGYLSLSQGAFIGIGAYVGAILANRMPDVPPLLWVPVAGVVGAGIAMLLGLVTYRSRGPAFVIITVAFLFLAQFVAIEWVSVTNGSSGLTLPLPDWPEAWGNWPFHLVLVALLALSLLMTWWIRRTKFGMGLIAIRDDEGKAGTIGVNAPVYKLLAFGASALFVGMAGSAYGYYLSFVDPIGMFSIITSALIVLSVILGGRGTLFGPVLGAFIIQPVNNLANDAFGGGNARLVIFGGLLILLVILLPKGILPTIADLLEKARTKGTVGLSGARLNPLDRPITAVEVHAPKPTGRTLLEVRGLHKSFGGNHAVNDCSFTVPEGSITALIGPNGSGKTTVFNLISGTMTPDQGQILMNGEEVEKLSPWSRAHRGIGRTFQITRLFKEMTVLENVVAPLRDFTFRQLGLGAVSGSEAARAEELLEFVGMAAYRDARAGALSYGQQKLVELAQVLMLDPKLILLDEPAGGINPTLIERMGDLIRSLNAQGTTFLLVEHNMPFVVGLCDPIRVLARGAVISEGTPQQIQKDPLVLDAYLGDDYLLEAPSKATTKTGPANVSVVERNPA